MIQMIQKVSDYQVEIKDKIMDITDLLYQKFNDMRK